ncbi:hypothetical protein PHLGIDRAFT_15915 [Phlebiopsis gigantea 11061_1 CR5-6]|uniref:Uncharacterized protein n=1 Tax=Phlebiopsis gigantea (strain 11061_1 CR5-6) TaxID=745531 RepID=A0A0C3NFB2_PHLG1|nr:hypothetical protein PHLGIDRAFT_15915 [Phlebiopsis gigantea 11061_1 CR5-6]
MRTPDSPTFHIRHLPKRIRQGTPTPRKPSLSSSDDTLVSDEPIRDNGKGKEVERWLHHVEASRSLPARAGANFAHDFPPPTPVCFEMDVDDDCISAATAGGSPSATYSDDEDVEGARSVADWGTPPPPGGGEDGDDDADSAASGSWGGSDSSWATTVRGGDSLGEWAIVAHPEWVQAARRVAYSATTRRDVCDTGRVELPLWRRMLRAVLPFV